MNTLMDGWMGKTSWYAGMDRFRCVYAPFCHTDMYRVGSSLAALRTRPAAAAWVRPSAVRARWPTQWSIHRTLMRQ
eukprot:scaffold80531_cov21-Prasinocladus_malaysianus.AAC.1